jgi:predicted DNA-binding antitoxin AbrB/MazE fold protein
MKPVEAEFDNGVLHPVKPLRLRQGERVRLIVLRSSDPARWNLERMARAANSEDEALAEAGLTAWADDLDREERK